jgi:hypothetical protein
MTPAEPCATALQAAREALAAHGLDRALQFTRTLTSAVTTAWGVNWDEEFIARDLLQNFFDSNRQRLDEIRIQIAGTQAAISAPAPFNLERLFFLGSEKGVDDVGQYGEGFKVAAMCLMRDHGVTPIAVSEHDLVVLRVAAEAITDTRLRPIEYDFYRLDRPVPGTVLLLNGCSGKLNKAVSGGLAYFFHERNPLLGGLRWTTYDRGFSIYDSTDGRGHVFYRNLKRAGFDGIPVVLVIDKPYASVERKISQDRDRKAFGEDVMKLLYSHFAKKVVRLSYEPERILVEAGRPCWEVGHPLLAELADAYGCHVGWPAELSRQVFGDRYYARNPRRPDPAIWMEAAAIEVRWQAEGRVQLPGYFSKFGVPSATSEIYQAQIAAAAEAREAGQRPPTPAERQGIDVLFRILQELAPMVAAVFETCKTSYTIARSEAILGQLRTARAYRSQEVYLAESLFEDSLSRALAVFLHEHAHIFGYDGSRGFSDALTQLLETVVLQRRDFDAYEALWTRASEAVAQERHRVPVSSRQTQAVSAWLASVQPDDLRQLIATLPAPVLRKVLLARLVGLLRMRLEQV